MVNVYDILINLIDSERVYEFFEWSIKDNIEHIKKIPLVKVTTNFLDTCINNCVIIENEFLDKIYQKTEVYNNDKIGVIEYACLFTDGYKVIAIEFNNEGKSLYKSYLYINYYKYISIRMKMKDYFLNYLILHSYIFSYKHRKYYISDQHIS